MYTGTPFWVRSPWVRQIAKSSTALLRCGHVRYDGLHDNHVGNPVAIICDSLLVFSNSREHTRNLLFIYPHDNLNGKRGNGSYILYSGHICFNNKIKAYTVNKVNRIRQTICVAYCFPPHYFNIPQHAASAKSLIFCINLNWEVLLLLPHGN